MTMHPVSRKRLDLVWTPLLGTLLLATLLNAQQYAGPITNTKTAGTLDVFDFEGK